MKKIIFLTLLFLALPDYVKAYCSDQEMIRLQRIAKNINSSYNYNETNGSFQITLTNLKNDLIIYDLYDDKYYNTNEDLVFNDLYSGKHTYIIYAKNENCTEHELATINVELPYINTFYNSSECKGIENYSYCSKWVERVIPEEIWSAKVKTYKEKFKKKKTTKEKASFLQELFNNYQKYYYIVLPAVIMLFSAVIIIKNRKDSLV